ncbi:MAG: ABC transporter permease [Synechococcus sp.]
MQRFWGETLAVARRISIELLRRRRSLIFWGIFPLILLLLNGSILAERRQIELAEALGLAAPVTLVGAALFFSCLGGSVAIVVAEREQQTLKRLFVSPLSGTAYFCGIFAAHFAIGLGQTLLVATSAIVLGATLTGSLSWSFLTLVLSVLSYVGVGFILGTQLARRTEDVNALVATFGVPLLVLGGTFVPAFLFPEHLLAIAQFNPIYHMNEAILAATDATPDWPDFAPHLWVLGLFAAASVLFGWLSYRRMLIQERSL